MNGRQKKHLRALGMDSFEAKKYLEELKQEYKNAKITKVHCAYEDYHPTDKAQESIIAQARKLYICGKHAGSKPLGRLKSRIADINKQLARYNTALKAMERIEARQKAKESENIEEVQIEDVN